MNGSIESIKFWFMSISLIVFWNSWWNESLWISQILLCEISINSTFFSPLKVLFLIFFMWLLAKMITFKLLDWNVSFSIS